MEIVTVAGDVIVCSRITFNGGYVEAWNKDAECIWSEKSRDVLLIRELDTLVVPDRVEKVTVNDREFTVNKITL